MTYSSRKVKKGYEMLVHGIDCKALAFKLIPAVAKALDPAGVQSQFPPKVLFIHDIQSFYHYSIQELGTLEMN